MDRVPPQVRSKIMASIHSKNTKPEVILRKHLHSRGFRFSLHSSKLPGSPDIILRKYNAVIQVNGCFWHGHNCHLFKLPKSRTEFWQKKITKNQLRDKRTCNVLLQEGWRVLIVWECAIKGKNKIETNILASLVENWLLVGNDFSEICGNNLLDPLQ